MVYGAAVSRRARLTMWGTSAERHVRSNRQNGPDGFLGLAQVILTGHTHEMQGEIVKMRPAAAIEIGPGHRWHRMRVWNRSPLSSMITLSLSSPVPRRVSVVRPFRLHAGGKPIRALRVPRCFTFSFEAALHGGGARA